MISKTSAQKRDEHGFYFEVTIPFKGEDKILLVDSGDYFNYVQGKNRCINDSSRHCKTFKYYAKMNVGSRAARKTTYLHRLVCPVLSPSIVIDHKDGNGLNNRQYNLMPTTQPDNAKRQIHAIRRKSHKN